MVESYLAATAASEQQSDPTGEAAARRLGYKRTVQGVRPGETFIYLRSCLVDPDGGEFDIVYKAVVHRLGFDTGRAVCLATSFASIVILAGATYLRCGSDDNSCTRSMEVCVIAFAIFPAMMILVYSIWIVRQLLLCFREIISFFMSFFVDMCSCLWNQDRDASNISEEEETLQGHNRSQRYETADSRRSGGDEALQGHDARSAEEGRHRDDEANILHD